MWDLCPSRDSLTGVQFGVSVLVHSLFAFIWESHGYHLKATSRVLQTVRDVVGFQTVLDGDETLPPVV